MNRNLLTGQFSIHRIELNKVILIFQNEYEQIGRSKILTSDGM
jgi:hypothetical protein